MSRVRWGSGSCTRRRPDLSTARRDRGRSERHLVGDAVHPSVETLSWSNIRQSLIIGYCVIRISGVVPAASWSPIVQRPWSGSVTHAELESLGSGKLHGSGPEAGNLQVVSAVGPVDDVENELRSGCHLDHPGEIGHHLAPRAQEQRSMSRAMGSFRGTVVAFPDLGVTPGLGRTTAWSVASYRHDAVS